MVILLGLAAAVLYGSGDFLGGMATRRAHVLTVLTLVETAGVIVALAAAAMWPGPAGVAGLAWGISAGLVGGLGLIVFYTGLAAGPMSVVAPVSGLVSTVLPVAVALAEGERPGPGVYAGALLCLVAIVLASSAGGTERGGTSTARRPGAWAGPSPTARLRASRSACSSCSSATPGSPARCGRWRPAGSASWRPSWPRRPCCGQACCAASAVAFPWRRSPRAASTSWRTSAMWRPPGPARSAWPWCWPRCTPGSPCCWPGSCSASGCGGFSARPRPRRLGILLVAA